MYEDNNPGFSFKDKVLKILFVVLLIFIVVWLFPTKNYVSNLIDNKMGTSVSKVFSSNIETMKSAALAYYNGSRLPEKEGEKKTLTLGEMLNKNLLVEFTDSKGKSCDNKKSYVEITKNKEDYSMKINLSCSDKKGYVYSYIGDYDYCTDGVCEKKKLTSEASEEKKEETNTQTTNENDVSQNTSSSECQYAKKSGGYWTNYGSWSAWTTQKINSSNSRQVQTKVEKRQTSTTTVQSGTTTKTQNPKKVIVTNNGVKSTLYICPADFDNGGKYTQPKLCVKTVPIYKQVPVYSNVTLYSYRDRKYVSNNSTYKWSSCNDQSLINSGYTATGKTR